MVSCSDLVYYLSLLTCIILGGCYKNLKDPTTKRTYGTGLGILITCMICGSSVLHSVLMVWGNIVIIKCCNKRYIHQLSLAYTWLYLIYMNYNMDITTIYVLWIHQVIALRLVGLACEITLAEKYKPQIVRTLADTTITSMNRDNLKFRQELPTKKSASRISNRDLACRPEEPSAADIISYAYYFIGLHKGPYYRWKTFNEHFKTPFGVLGNCRIITEQKLKKTLIFGILYMVLRLQFPVQVYYENDFYDSHGTDFRYLYNIPQMLTYVFQCQVVMMLCTSVCTEAGFGIYPAKMQPLPGHGPSTKLSLLDLLFNNNNNTFDNEYVNLKDSEIFQVVKVNNPNPVTYQLKDERKQPILGGFYEQELQKGKYPDVYQVAKVSKRNCDDTFLVKCFGMDSTSWINKENKMN